MTNFSTNKSPSYLTPVYNPIQFDLFFNETTSSTSTYSFQLNFDLTAITAFSGSPTYTLNGYVSTISRTPSQNQIPNPEFPNFIYYVQENLNNNPLFDDYQINVIDEDSIQLIHKTPYTVDRIIFSGETFYSYSEQFPEYLYSAQTRNNYGVWFEVYTDSQKNIFKTFLTGDSTNKVFQSDLYKSFQNVNSYLFNVNTILQSNSRTDNWNTLNSQSLIFFQKDLNSLRNSLFVARESYDITFSGVTSVRKQNMTIQAKSAFEDVWYWDASREFDFDSEPYYNINYEGFELNEHYLYPFYTFLFKYNPVKDENLYITNSVSGYSFTVADTNNFSAGEFKLENTLSGTAQNFISAFTTNLTGYSVSSYTKGYSQVYVTFYTNTYDTNLNLNVNDSDHIILVDYQQAVQYNQIELPFNQNTILFLTDRPRQDTYIYYDYTSDNEIVRKNNSLSIFLSTYDNTDLPADIITQGFKVYSKAYAGNLWTDEWVESDPIEFDWSTGKDNGLYHVNLDPYLYNYNINVYDKIKFKVVLYVTNTGGTFVTDYSEEFIYNTKAVCEFENVKSFTFLNDLGGWDYYDCIENLTTDYNKESTLILNDYTKPIDGSTTYEQVFQNNIEKTYSVTTVVNTEEEYNWLYQMIKSSRVYLINDKSTDTQVDDILVPIIITSSDYKNVEFNKNLTLSFTYRIAQKDFSQKSI